MICRHVVVNHSDAYRRNKRTNPKLDSCIRRSFQFSLSTLLISLIVLMAASLGNVRLLPFHFRYFPQFISRNYSVCSNILPSNHAAVVVDDPQMFVQSVRDQCKLGFPTPEIPISFFHQLKSLQPLPSIVIFNQLFSAMSKIQPHPPFSSVISLSNQLEFSGLRPNNYFIGILVNCYCRLGRVDFGFSLLGKLIKLGYPLDSSVIIFNTLMHSLCKDRRLSEAFGLFDDMKANGVSLDVVSYNTLIRGLCSLGRWNDCKDMLVEMSEKNIEPDVNTYSTLIDMFCKHGNVNEAWAIIGFMVKRGVQPNVFTYTTLLDGCCLRGQLVEAENLVDVMARDGIVPNVVTFNALIKGYCQSNQVDKAMIMFKNKILNTTFIAPDVFTYNTLFGGLLKNSLIDRAIFLRKEMQINGVTPDIYTYSIIINGLCETGQLAEASEVLSYLVDKELPVNVKTFNILIKGLCRQGLLGGAETALLKQMADKGFTPDECTYYTIIKGFLNANDVVSALDYLDNMRSQGFAVGAKTSSLFVGLLIHPNVSDTNKGLLQKYF